MQDAILRRVWDFKVEEQALENGALGRIQYFPPLPNPGKTGSIAITHCIRNYHEDNLNSVFPAISITNSKSL